MIDIEALREDPQGIEAMLARRGVAPQAVQQLVQLDTDWRVHTEKLEILRAEKNRANRDIAQATDEARKRLIAHMKEISGQEEVLAQQSEIVAAERLAAWRQLPNVLLPDVPDGGAADALLVREVGNVPAATTTPRSYLELGEGDLFDLSRAAKVSGSRFVYLKSYVARLELGLISFAVDHVMKSGFSPVLPPVLVGEHAMSGMGYLEQAGEREIYRTQDDLYLVGTSEQALGPLYMNETLAAEQVPLRLVGVSSCFRREAGSHGKDVRGIVRLHQFDKVEMFSFTAPESSIAEHEFLLQQQEELMQALAVPYRVVLLAAQDLGHPSAKTYDIETWLPSEGRYRETHSTSNTTDYQSRRLNIRLKDGAKDTVRPHLLNGTALAIPRILIALLENHQQPDGSVLLPPALHSYVPFTSIPSPAERA